ncbi:hypothetical protein J6590_021467 [Homalodisca vitripennis]|nr:hypothetical protein J6590_021467 [Homalodisca vitripennis]
MAGGTGQSALVIIQAIPINYMGMSKLADGLRGELGEVTTKRTPKLRVRRNVRFLPAHDLPLIKTTAKSLPLLLSTRVTTGYHHYVQTSGHMQIDEWSANCSGRDSCQCGKRGQSELGVACRPMPVHVPPAIKTVSSFISLIKRRGVTDSAFGRF